MAKIKSDGNGQWEKDDNELRCRRIYDIHASDKRGHSVLVTFRWTDEDAALLKKILNSGKSPEFESCADVLRGLMRDAMKSWFLERTFPENSLHHAIKLMFKEMDRDTTDIILRKTLAKKMEIYSRKKSPSDVRDSLKRVIKNLPADEQEEIYNSVGNEWETGKITKTDISGIIKDLRDEEWIKERLDK